jgi:hypothetical protein
MTSSPSVVSASVSTVVAVIVIALVIESVSVTDVVVIVLDADGSDALLVSAPSSLLSSPAGQPTSVRTEAKIMELRKFSMYASAFGRLARRA